MADFDTLKGALTDLTFNARNAMVLLAKYDDDPVLTIESPTTGDLEIPTEYESVGHFEKKAGISIGMDVTSNDVEAYGELDPIRILLTKRETSIEVSLYEHKKLVQEIVWSQNLDSITPTSHGGVVIEAEHAPDTIFYRAIIVGRDRINNEYLYPFWLMPKVQLSKMSNVELNDEGVLMYKPTLRALRDDTTGYAVAQGWCGPGWRRVIDKTGFAPPLTSISATPAAPSIAALATQQITVTDSNAIVRTPDCKYAVTTGGAFATVSAAGLVTGVAAGSATVTVTLKRVGAADLTDTVAVTVT